MDEAKVVAICVAGALAAFLALSAFAACLIKLRDKRRRRELEEARRRRQFQVYYNSHNFPTCRHHKEKKSPRESLSNSAQSRPACTKRQDMNLLIQCMSESSSFAADPSPRGLPRLPPSYQKPSNHTRDSSSKSAFPLKRLSSIIESPRGHPANRDHDDSCTNALLSASPSDTVNAFRVMKSDVPLEERARRCQGEDDHGNLEYVPVPKSQTLEPASTIEPPQRAHVHMRSVSLSSQMSGPPQEPLPPLPIRRSRVSQILSSAPSDRERSTSALSLSSADTVGSSILIHPGNKPRLETKELMTTRFDHEEIRAQIGTSALPGAPLNDSIATRKSPRITTPGDREKIMSSHCVLDDTGVENNEAASRACMLTSSMLNSPLEGDALVQLHSCRTKDVPLLRKDFSTSTGNRTDSPQQGLTLASGSPQPRRRLSAHHPQACPPDTSFQRTHPHREWRCVAPVTVFEHSYGALASRPSNLKGSPNARKGHRRQTAVRIMSKPVSFDMPRSRERSMPSVLEQEDVQSLPSSTCLPSLPSIPQFDPQLTVRPLSLRSSQGPPSCPPSPAIGVRLECLTYTSRRRSPISSLEPTHQRARPDSSMSSLLSLTAWPTPDGAGMQPQSPLQASQPDKCECDPPTLARGTFVTTSATSLKTTMEPKATSKSAPLLCTLSSAKAERDASLEFPQVDFSPSRAIASRPGNAPNPSPIPARSSIVLKPPIFQSTSRNRSFSSQPCALSSRKVPVGEHENVSMLPNPFLNAPILCPPEDTAAFSRTHMGQSILTTIQGLRRHESISSAATCHAPESPGERRFRNLGSEKTQSMRRPSDTMPNFSMRVAITPPHDCISSKLSQKVQSDSAEMENKENLCGLGYAASGKNDKTKSIRTDEPERQSGFWTKQVPSHQAVHQSVAVERKDGSPGLYDANGFLKGSLEE